MELNIFKEKIEEGWLKKLEPFLVSDEMDNIINQIKASKSLNYIWPTSEDCFNAFKYCEWDNLKVVIIGQD
jgi:uracil-DNA glycosylase